MSRNFFHISICVCLSRYFYIFVATVITTNFLSFLVGFRWIATMKHARANLTHFHCTYFHIFFLPSYSSLSLLSLFLFPSLSLERFTSLQQFVLCQLFPSPPFLSVFAVPFFLLFYLYTRVSHPHHSSSCPFILVPRFPLSDLHHPLDVFGPFANNAVLAPPRYFRWINLI